MKSNYDYCLPKLLKDEGGYTNDPNDNGGPTNFGITLIDYKKYINKNGTAVDVKNMKVDQAKVIYKEKYWNALDCDNLSSGVDYTCFDYGVNSGLGRPRKALQKFKSLSSTKLIDAINDERMAFLRAIGVGHNAKFMTGWTNRVSRVRAYSKQLATGVGRDQKSGPVAGATAGLTFFAMISQYIHNHPYIIAGGTVAVVVAIWAGVHYLRNK